VTEKRRERKDTGQSIGYWENKRLCHKVSIKRKYILYFEN
jgi:hypothetical protein